MTLQQLRLVSETAVHGSISAAAQQLHLSQPNASQSLKKLEEELGYAIFKRDEGRTVLTEQGYLFLEHAEAILREDTAIRKLNEYSDTPRLKVGSVNYTPAFEAFLRFVKENRDRPLCDLMCINVLPDKAPQLLRERVVDIVVSPQPKATFPTIQKMCKENRLTPTLHGELSLCVRVRADHPLVVSGKLDGSPEGFEYLKDYPYAEYLSMDYLLPLFQPASSTPFGYSYKIYADERDTRLKIIRNSNAYNIGVSLPPERVEKYGLKTFAFGASPIMLSSFVRNGDDSLRDIRRYRELLMEEAGL